MGNFFSISVSCDALLSRCLDCTVRKAKYVRELEDNLDELKNSLEDLIQTRNDVITRVAIAERQQMNRLHRVQLWITRVEAVETEVGDLLNVQSQEIQKLCLGGYCSKSCKSSYEFAKKVAKKLQVVAMLKEEGNFKDVAEKKLEDPVDERPIETTIVGLESMFDQVWRCLVEKQAGIIGLFGMGGVGKTTLLTQINNKFLDTPKDFDVVIWVVVPKQMQLEKIQESIGKKMGFFNESWKSASVQEKAIDIFKILSKKKFVLLLDDMWERIDLTKVGVPLPSSKNASKIVFTTREVEVCGLMEAHKCFKVECLAHEDAWKLFREKVGSNILSSHDDIPNLAETVAKECGGLPLALITIGRAMACKKTPQEWEYAIQVLRETASEFSGMRNNVYAFLKFSYDSLPSDTFRSCLLYCSLFPEDYSIHKRELIDCWIGEGFLDDCDESRAQNRGYYIIGILIGSCLLEEDDGHVKMHDVIRDMCLWIACDIDKEKENFLVHVDAGLTEAPEVEKWEGVRRISLMENEIENLLKVPKCPDLHTLFLNCNLLEVITTDFFQFMPSLRVLNLSSNPYLSEIPSGISRLVSLQHLDLSFTAVQELPKEMISLKNLKCLNLDCTINFRTVPLHLISNFPMLQVLRMFYCGSSSQESEDRIMFEDGEFFIEELLCLKHLSVLSLTLRSFHALQRILSLHKLKGCIQSLCLRYFDDSKLFNILSLADMKQLNSLYVTMCEDLEEMNFDYSGEVPKMLETHGFHSLQSVHIESCSKLKDVTWLFLAPNLKRIWILDCSNVEEIIRLGKVGEVQAMVGNLSPFAKLEFLILRNLRNLKSIYCNSLLFPHLKEIVVDECPKLNKLPLDYNSAKERKIVIKGEQKWWKKLQWEDQATENAFLPCFISFGDDEIDAEWRFWSII